MLSFILCQELFRFLTKNADFFNEDDCAYFVTDGWFNIEYISCKFEELKYLLYETSSSTGRW